MKYLSNTKKNILFIIYTLFIFSNFVYSNTTGTYKVKSGDTLFGISFAHNMDANTFFKLNGIKDYTAYKLKVGETFKVYNKEKGNKSKVGSTKANVSTKADKKSSSKPSTTLDKDSDIVIYKVKKGDTLSEIALSHLMDTIELYRINNLGNSHILRAGEELKVYTKDRIIYTKTLSNYKVRNGDSLYLIARKFGMNINELSTLNKIKNINTYNLLMGSNLKIYKTKAIEKTKVAKKRVVTLPKSSFAWPYVGSVLVGYGIKSDKVANRGINIKAKLGAKVSASDGGSVEYASLVRGYGMVVIIRHKNDYTTSYAHLSDIDVEVGDEVSKGEKIGSIGKTGFVEDYELYFKINYKGRPLNPISLLPKG